MKLLDFNQLFYSQGHDYISDSRDLFTRPDIKSI